MTDCPDCGFDHKFHGFASCPRTSSDNRTTEGRVTLHKLREDGDFVFRADGTYFKLSPADIRQINALAGFAPEPTPQERDVRIMCDNLRAEGLPEVATAIGSMQAHIMALESRLSGEPAAERGIGTLLNAGRRSLHQFYDGHTPLSVCANDMANMLSALIRAVSPEQPETKPAPAEPRGEQKTGFDSQASRLPMLGRGIGPEGLQPSAGSSSEPAAEHPHTRALRWIAESADAAKLTGAFAVDHARRALGLPETKRGKCETCNDTGTVPHPAGCVGPQACPDCRYGATPP